MGSSHIVTTLLLGLVFALQATALPFANALSEIIIINSYNPPSQDAYDNALRQGDWHLSQHDNNTYYASIHAIPKNATVISYVYQPDDSDRRNITYLGMLANRPKNHQLHLYGAPGVVVLAAHFAIRGISYMSRPGYVMFQEPAGGGSAMSSWSSFYTESMESLPGGPIDPLELPQPAQPVESWPKPRERITLGPESGAPGAKLPPGPDAPPPKPEIRPQDAPPKGGGEKPPPAEKPAEPQPPAKPNEQPPKPEEVKPPSEPPKAEELKPPVAEKPPEQQPQKPEEVKPPNEPPKVEEMKPPAADKPPEQQSPAKPNEQPPKPVEVKPAAPEKPPEQQPPAKPNEQPPKPEEIKPPVAEKPAEQQAPKQEEAKSPAAEKPAEGQPPKVEEVKPPAEPAKANEQKPPTAEKPPEPQPPKPEEPVPKPNEAKPPSEPPKLPPAEKPPAQAPANEVTKLPPAEPPSSPPGSPPEKPPAAPPKAPPVEAPPQPPASNEYSKVAEQLKNEISNAGADSSTSVGKSVEQSKQISQTLEQKAAEAAKNGAPAEKVAELRKASQQFKEIPKVAEGNPQLKLPPSGSPPVGEVVGAPKTPPLEVIKPPGGVPAEAPPKAPPVEGAPVRPAGEPVPVKPPPNVPVEVPPVPVEAPPVPIEAPPVPVDIPPVRIAPPSSPGGPHHWNVETHSLARPIDPAVLETEAQAEAIAAEIRYGEGHLMSEIEPWQVTEKFQKMTNAAGEWVGKNNIPYNPADPGNVVGRMGLDGALDAEAYTAEVAGAGAGNSWKSLAGKAASALRRGGSVAVTETMARLSPALRTVSAGLKAVGSTAAKIGMWFVRILIP